MGWKAIYLRMLPIESRAMVIAEGKHPILPRPSVANTTCPSASYSLVAEYPPPIPSVGGDVLGGFILRMFLSEDTAL